MSDTHDQMPQDAADDVNASDSAATKSDSDDGRDRRTYDRTALNAEISLTSESNLYAGFTGDVSEGGVFVATYQLLPIGTLVDVDISFEAMDGPHIVTKGEVRWHREESPTSDAKPGMGLRFAEIAEGDRAWIADFVGRREPLFHDEPTGRGRRPSSTGHRAVSEADVDLLRSRFGAGALAAVGALVALGVLFGYFLCAPSSPTRPPVSRAPGTARVDASQVETEPLAASADAMPSSTDASADADASDSDAQLDAPPSDSDAGRDVEGTADATAADAAPQ